MRLLTWNLEWAAPTSRRGRTAQDITQRYEPDVACFTEGRLGIAPSGGHSIEAGEDYGYPHAGDRRKVMLWSREPWEDVDRVGHPDLPGGRFVSGTTRGIVFIGVCIPWRDAHVRTGRSDRLPWEDHLKYLHVLRQLLDAKLRASNAICVAGDFNQRVPRHGQPDAAWLALQAVLNLGVRLLTDGRPDGDGGLLIDHVAVGPGLEGDVEGIVPKTTSSGLRLSDHVGVLARIERSRA